jgi:hypothetical protein
MCSVFNSEHATGSVCWIARCFGTKPRDCRSATCVIFHLYAVIMLEFLSKDYNCVHEVMADTYCDCDSLSDGEI